MCQGCFSLQRLQGRVLWGGSIPGRDSPRNFSAHISSGSVPTAGTRNTWSAQGPVSTLNPPAGLALEFRSVGNESLLLYLGGGHLTPAPVCRGRLPTFVVGCPWGHSSPSSTNMLLSSRSVVSDSLRPHGLQHARSPCPSPTPGACSNSCPSTRWCHPTLSHPLSSPSPPAFNLSQHQGLFQGVSSSHQVARLLELQLQHQSFQWIFRTDFL